MDRKIIWAETAYSDLQAVFDFIARDSTVYAASFAQKAIDTAESLIEMPMRFKIVPEFNANNIRETLVFNYRLIYKVDEHSITIIAMVHGSRDLQALWEKEKRTI
jgi:plasmid stabilization system protein ParE